MPLDSCLRRHFKRVFNFSFEPYMSNSGRKDSGEIVKLIMAKMIRSALSIVLTTLCHVWSVAKHTTLIIAIINLTLLAIYAILLQGFTP
jgi:hypothetical protein